MLAPTVSLVLHYLQLTRPSFSLFPWPLRERAKKDGLQYSTSHCSIMVRPATGTPWFALPPVDVALLFRSTGLVAISPIVAGEKIIPIVLFDL
ncbi:hypothetical protein EX30DRAFT_340353 [Ascodesmis nigricans]|uniref:Uncharacterized protein n=1 Tax=Ascodesmis nigricans TaxID=341454 RepID=A0A4S2MZD7_9PEZI|nr:hypothetical protein EX30DRAFT_340353 [Ascodesmis nigricans]